jgi:signal transduction histidine kinase
MPERRVLRRHSSTAWHDGRVVGRVFTYTDVTRAAELDRVRADFVARASHELRTPLTSIHGALQLGLAGTADRLDPEDRELFEVSVASTERLCRLVNRMVDLSKVEAGRMPMERTPLPRMLVDQHGGHIWAERRPDRQGTCFAFTIPQAPEPTPQAPLAAAPATR